MCFHCTKNITEYKQAMAEEMIATGDVQLKCKQITPPSAARARADCTPYDK